MPDTQDLPAFDPDEFATAFIFANNAASNNATVTNPSDLGINLDLGNGQVKGIQFSDIPMNRMMVALKERYGHEPTKFYSACFRTWSLINIAHRPELSEWVIRHEDGAEMHDVMVEAAAVTKLDQHGEFPLNEFMESVRYFLSTKYADK